jgi:hypothetical protein
MRHKLAASPRRASLPGFRGALATAWRERPALRRVALMAALAFYAAISLEPFDWQVPRRVVNHTERLPEGWRFAASGIVVAEPPHRWLEAARRTETMDVSLLVRPLATVQSGPARILTISRDAHLRNLTIGQEDDDLVVRLRTEQTDLNGLREGEPLARVEDAFRAGRWVAIDLQIRPRALALAIDGQPALALGLPEAVLATWQSSLKLALGNETTCDRPWLGEIRSAVIEVAGEAVDYARSAEVEAPATCWVIGYPPVVVPFRLLFPEDIVRNVLMYVPLGCLLGLSIRRRSYRALAGGLLAVLAVSVALEGAQMLVASRFTSVDDIVCNTIGGALGLGLAWRLARGASGPSRA